MDLTERTRGSILGLAIGDALGHPTEFLASVDAIRSKYGPLGVVDFVPLGAHPRGTFTDDTQMTIAVARALVRAGHRDLDALMTLMGEEFVAWARAPENNRAPGGTCLAGCRELAHRVPWRTAGVRNSKGCGAAMRAAPIGLYHHDDVDALVRVAAAQSSLTHRHPTATASSVAAAAAVAHVIRTGAIDGMLAFTRACVERLTPALLRDVGADEAASDALGASEMLEHLDRTEEVLDRDTDDVCRLLGGAWVGEEAVATALWCVLKANGDFREAVIRGANSSGDSDSIACIAGSIAGALVGARALPEAWVTGVEKAELLRRLADALVRARAGSDEPSTPADLDPFGAEDRDELDYESDSDTLIEDEISEDTPIDGDEDG
ncbi:MAG: ADP-ribosylglycohydrolase family protein [Polyangiaceae bacterium]